MPKSEPKAELTVNDPRLAAVLWTLNNIRQQISPLRKAEDETKAEATQLLSGYLAESGAGVVHASDEVSVTIGNNPGQPRIDGQRLLELGVSPEIVQQATKRSPFVTLTIKVKTPISLAPVG